MHQFGQHRCLITGAGADFQNCVSALGVEQLGHERDDVGLGNGLAVPYRQGPVGIGQRAVRRGHEAMARHLGYGCHHARAEYRPTGFSAGIARHGFDLFQQGLALAQVRILRLGAAAGERGDQPQRTQDRTRFFFGSHAFQFSSPVRACHPAQLRRFALSSPAEDGIIRPWTWSAALDLRLRCSVRS